MRLESRVRKLEGGRSQVKVVLTEECLDAEAKQAFAESYRREHGLAPDTVVVVIDGRDAVLL